MARHKSPRVPVFRSAGECAPFDPINLFDVFVSGSVIRAIAGAPKLGPGQKLVLLVLADQCLRKGYDWHSQRELGVLCGMSMRQFRRHLARLRKLRFVHVAPDFGRQDTTWCLYNPVFANCSPLTPDRSVLGGRTEVSYGVGQKWPTHGLNMDSSHGLGSVAVEKATSYRGSLARNGRKNGEEAAAAENTGPDFRERRDRKPTFAPNGVEPTTHKGIPLESERLAIARDARRFWYSLSIPEKQRRFDHAASLHARIVHFRPYLKDAHAEIARQAKHEITRALDELRSSGFTIHTTETRTP